MTWMSQISFYLAILQESLSLENSEVRTSRLGSVGVVTSSRFIGLGYRNREVWACVWPLHAVRQNFLCQASIIFEVKFFGDDT